MKRSFRQRSIKPTTAGRRVSLVVDEQFFQDAQKVPDTRPRGIGERRRTYFSTSSDVDRAQRRRWSFMAGRLCLALGRRADLAGAPRHERLHLAGGAVLFELFLENLVDLAVLV